MSQTWCSRSCGKRTIAPRTDTAIGHPSVTAPRPEADRSGAGRSADRTSSERTRWCRPAGGVPAGLPAFGLLPLDRLDRAREPLPSIWAVVGRVTEGIQRDLVVELDLGVDEADPVLLPPEHRPDAG